MEPPHKTQPHSSYRPGQQPHQQSRQAARPDILLEVAGARYTSPPTQFGVALPAGSREERSVQDTLVSLCRSPLGLAFPGSQPVSLDRRNMREITKAPSNYLVAEKSDGTRYLMLINKEATYLIDRSFRVRKLHLHFPFPAHKAAAQTPPILDKTLLDGELVIDHVDDVYIVNYLVYDAISWMGEPKIQLSLDQRLKCVQNDVLWPRKQDHFYDYSKEPMNIKLKEFMALKNLPFLFDHVIPNLKHENDGLIFTPIKLPYVVGTCRQLLKWKPNSLNSVDFELKVEFRARKRGYCLLAAEKLAKRFYAWITFSEEDRAMFDNDRMASGKIIECVWDDEWPTWIPAPGADTWDVGEWKKGGWRYMRIREDKTLANDISVIERIQRSRADNITQSELLDLLVPSAQKPPAQHNPTERGTSSSSAQRTEPQSPAKEDPSAATHKRSRPEDETQVESEIEDKHGGEDADDDKQKEGLTSAKKQRIDFLLADSSQDGQEGFDFAGSRS